MAGFSGGRKLIAPGLAAQETIKQLHSPRFMREPLAQEGSIAQNPLHLELLEIARMARHDFMLDVTLTRERKISGVFAGAPIEAHAAGVAFVEQTCLERLEEPVDAVITSAAGYPLDLTFYQIVKGITAAAHMVKPGGRILIVAQCAEGVGSAEFARRLASLRDFRSFLDEIGSAPVEVDQWQLEKLALTGEKYELSFFTPGVTRGQLGFLGESSFSTLEGLWQRHWLVCRTMRGWRWFRKGLIRLRGPKSRSRRFSWIGSPRRDDGTTEPYGSFVPSRS
jgi:hypothetical protein